MKELAQRILNFYEFLYNNNLEGGITWHENEWHVTINGKQPHSIFSYGQQKTLTLAMDECIQGLKKAGFWP